MDVIANTKYAVLLCLEANSLAPGLFGVVSDDAVKYTGPMQLEWDIKGVEESWALNFLGYGKRLGFNKVKELAAVEEDILCAVIPKSRIRSTFALIRAHDTKFIDALVNGYSNYREYLRCAGSRY